MQTFTENPDKIDALGRAIAESDRPADVLYAVVCRLAEAARLPRAVTASALHKAASEWEDMAPSRQLDPHA
jgi:hypothetical protein